MSKHLQWDSTRKGWTFEVRGDKSAVFFGASKSKAGALYTLYRQRQKQTVEEIRLWVLNDEGLYNWARRSGVRI